jgi:diacylglycerol kinase family enzyme
MPNETMTPGIAVPMICVLVNGGSGKQKARDAITRITAAFNDLGVAAEVRQIERRVSIERQVERAIGDGFATLVAAGGDGTISAVAAAVVAHPETRLGVIPLGTFNYFGRSLSLPDDIAAAVAVVAAGHETRLDVGFVNDRIFLNNASLGAYPAILQKREDVYRSWGRSRIAAYWSVIASLWQRRGHLEAHVEGQGGTRRVKAAMIMCVSNAYQLRDMQLREADQVSGGVMALYITPQKRPLELIGSAIRLLRRMPQKQRDYDVLTGTDFTVRPRRARQRVARDGEWHKERGPFRFRLVPGALRMIVPKPAADASA